MDHWGACKLKDACPQGKRFYFSICLCGFYLLSVSFSLYLIISPFLSCSLLHLFILSFLLSFSLCFSLSLSFSLFLSLSLTFSHFFLFHALLKIIFFLSFPLIISFISFPLIISFISFPLIIFFISFPLIISLYFFVNNIFYI